MKNILLFVTLSRGRINTVFQRIILLISLLVISPIAMSQNTDPRGIDTILGFQIKAERYLRIYQNVIKPVYDVSELIGDASDADLLVGQMLADPKNASIYLQRMYGSESLNDAVSLAKSYYDKYDKFQFHVSAELHGVPAIVLVSEEARKAVMEQTVAALSKWEEAEEKLIDVIKRVKSQQRTITLGLKFENARQRAYQELAVDAAAITGSSGFLEMFGRSEQVGYAAGWWSSARSQSDKVLKKLESDLRLVRTNIQTLEGVLPETWVEDLLKKLKEAEIAHKTAKSEAPKKEAQKKRKLSLDSFLDSTSDSENSIQASVQSLDTVSRKTRAKVMSNTLSTLSGITASRSDRNERTSSQNQTTTQEQNAALPTQSESESQSRGRQCPRNFTSDDGGPCYRVCSDDPNGGCQ